MADLLDEVLAQYNSGDPIKDIRAMQRELRVLFGKDLRAVRAEFNTGDPVKDARAMLRESRALLRQLQRKSSLRSSRRKATSASNARSRRSR